MGVASYYEDIYHRWLSCQQPLPVDLVEGPPLPFRCPFCGARFPTDIVRTAHIEREHRAESPVLLLNGRAALGIEEISVPLPRGNVILANCTSVSMSKNGSPWTDLPVGRARKALEERANATIHLRMRNQFHKGTAPIERQYEVRIAIPDDLILIEIEKRFARAFGEGNVTGIHLLAFQEELPSGYAEGKYGRALGSYAQGVLLRNRGPGATRPAAEFKECYTEAAAEMAKHARPLARLVCGLSRFALNDFSGQWSGTGWIRLDRVLLTIQGIVGFTQSGAQVLGDGTPKAVCPTDQGTDKVISLSENLAGWMSWHQSEYQQLRSTLQATLDPFDRVKAQVLFAATAVRIKQKAVAASLLDDLVGDGIFGKWAEHLSTP